MKHIILYLFILANTISLFGQAQKHVNLFYGKGFPIGQTSYPTNVYQSAALFANMSSNTHLAIESHFVYKENVTLGFLMQYTNYSKWYSPSCSDRYRNVSLKSFDLGFVLGYELENLSFSVFNSRLLLTPMASFVKYSNDNNSFTAQGKCYNDKGVLLSSRIELSEPAKSFIQVLPAVSAALEYSFSVINQYGGFVRCGITAGLANSTSYYPDKYYVYPTMSLGLSINREGHNYSKTTYEFGSGQSSESVKISDGLIRDFCISPTYTKLYIASENALQIYDIKKHTIIGNLDSGNTNQFSSIDVSADGKLLAAASPNGVVYVWSLINNQLVNTISTNKLDINCIRFSDKGRSILLGLASCEIMCYNLVTSNLEKTIALNSDPITSLAISDTLDLLTATTANGTVALLNASALTVLNSTPIHKGKANESVLLAEWNHFYTCGSDGKVYNHRIRDNTFTSEVVKTKFGSGDISSVDAMNNDVIAYCEKGGKVFIFSRYSGFTFKSKSPISKLRFTNSNDYIIVVYSTLKGLYMANSLDMKGIDSVIDF